MKLLTAALLMGAVVAQDDAAAPVGPPIGDKKESLMQNVTINDDKNK